jgi:hypothetical protein
VSFIGADNDKLVTGTPKKITKISILVVNYNCIYFYGKRVLLQSVQELKGALLMKSAALRSYRKYRRETGTTFSTSRKKNRILSIIMISIVSLLLSIISGPALVFAQSSGIYWTDYASKPTLSGTTYTITSAAQLAWVAKQVNAGIDFAGYTIEISDRLSSIDLSAHYWKPIGYTTFGAGVDRSFSGTFDGNTIPISHLKIGDSGNPESNHYYVGLFGYAKKAEIKNTCITNAAV